MLQSLKNILHLLTAFMAVLRYGYPARKLTVIGVTGTDGKTTTSELIYHILAKSGRKTSLISTVRAVINGKEYDTGFHVTTPSPFALQRYIKKAREGSSNYIVIEVTSHALDQYRTFGTSIDIGLITNVTHEHLDYHKTFANYLSSKAKILEKVKYSVLNKDDKNFVFLKEKAGGKLVTFAVDSDADYTKTNYSFKSSLMGKFNDYNNLAAITVAKIIGVADKDIQNAVSTFKGIQGRLDEIKTDRNFRIFIDFAHKPNALQNVLETMHEQSTGKLIVVFGCAGLRDTLKRPMMGEIAGKLADYTVLTAEDPRTEDVRDIISDIAVGAKKKAKEMDKGKTDKIDRGGNAHYFWRIPDRQEAINFAVRKLAQIGDVVIVTGKGHEMSMCYGTTEYPWSDKEAILKALHEKPIKT